MAGGWALREGHRRAAASSGGLGGRGGLAAGEGDRRGAADGLGGLHRLPPRGELLAGVIYNPFTDEMFTAEKGKGARLNGRPIHANADPAMRDALTRKMTLQ